MKLRDERKKHHALEKEFYDGRWKQKTSSITKRTRRYTWEPLTPGFDFLNGLLFGVFFAPN